MFDIKELRLAEGRGEIFRKRGLLLKIWLNGKGVSPLLIGFFNFSLFNNLGKLQSFLKVFQTIVDIHNLR